MRIRLKMYCTHVILIIKIQFYKKSFCLKSAPVNFPHKAVLKDRKTFNKYLIKPEVDK